MHLSSRFGQMSFYYYYYYCYSSPSVYVKSYVFFMFVCIHLYQSFKTMVLT